METLFDYVTIGCFLVVVGAFFALTTRKTQTLLQLVLAGVAFAVANQIGNAGYGLLAAALIIAGIGYSAMVIRGG